MLKELVENGVKLSVKDVVFVAKDKTGQTVWLENGDEKTGLIHIRKHTNDFVIKHDIKPDNLTKHLKNVIKRGKVISVTKKSLANGRIGLEKYMFISTNTILLLL